MVCSRHPRADYQAEQRTTRAPLGRRTGRPMSNEPKTVILQERRQLVRAGLAAILEKQEDLAVIASVEADDELRDAVRDAKPDVVVLELDPPWDLRALVAELRDAHPDIRIVAVHKGRQSDLGRRPVEAQIDALAAY